MKRQPGKTTRRLSGLLLVGLLACEPDPRYRESWDPLAPVAFAGRVAYVERTAATAFVIDPADPELRPRLFPVGAKARLAVARNGHPQLLVLAQGQPGDSRTRAEPASLSILPADPAGPSAQVPLPGRFDTLAQSDDGRFLVLHHSAGAKSQAEVLFNPNEVAVVDLEAPTGVLAAPRTLRSFGSRPLAVVFAPPLAVPGVGRPLRLAVVLSEGYVTLFDLEDGARNEVSISLALPDDPRAIRPVEVLFDEADLGREPTVFVRAQGSNDIYALRLVAVDPAARALPGNDWRPVLSLLGAGFEPSDVELFDGPEGRGRLLLVSPAQSAAFVIDPQTSAVTAIPLDTPASQILLYQAPAPGDPTPAARALLLGLGTGAGVGFLDLVGLEELRGRNLETRPMGAVVLAALAMPERQLVIAQHQASGGPAGLSVIDLARRTISPLVADDLAHLVLGGPGSDQVWVAPRLETRIGFVTLPGLETGQVRLDLPVRALLPLGPGADGRLRVAIDHDDPAGAVTFVDAAAPSRLTARSVVGIFYQNLLDREVP